jgi:transaldolase
VKIPYLKWMSKHTCTRWWQDSAIEEELIGIGLENGAVGATINPVLVSQSLKSTPAFWKPLLDDVPRALRGQERAEAVLERMYVRIAAIFHSTYVRTAGAEGYVCAQVNPALANDAVAMIAEARRFAGWAPNIAVKLPVTREGLHALETCISEGITITATVSFTVAQVLAIAESHRKALERASTTGQRPGRCFAVVMVGRLDDYLNDLIKDRALPISPNDVWQGSVAVTKRASCLLHRMTSRPVLMPAGFRNPQQVAALSGLDGVLSIHGKIQAMMVETDLQQSVRVDQGDDAGVLDRMLKLAEFRQAYEPDGLCIDDFSSYGATARTLRTFKDEGWDDIENYGCG